MPITIIAIATATIFLKKNYSTNYQLVDENTILESSSLEFNLKTISFWNALN